MRHHASVELEAKVNVMVLRTTVTWLCLLAVLAHHALAGEWVDGVYGTATDERGRLLIHTSAMTPVLEDLVRSPEPYPAVYVVTDEMRVYFAQDGYFSSMAYAHFFDSTLLEGNLTVRIPGSPRIDALIAYRQRQNDQSERDYIPTGGPLVCTMTELSMRCNRGAEIVYQHECTYDPVGQTLVCRF